MAPQHPEIAILVADDEPLTRWALMRTFEAARFEVTLAASRDEVMQLLGSRRFQVAIVAHELGRDSMADVLGAFVAQSPGPGLVILYGGENPDDVRKDFPTATVVQKPFCLEAVAAAVSSCLQPTSEAC